MAVASVQQVLGGKLATGETVTVQGWVRTRRDSKAGLSFINVSDGSCFAPIQVVAPSILGNYDIEVRKLTAGCSVRATGVVAVSEGQGQVFELQATEIEVVGWVDDPETYPIQPKAHSLEFLREVAHLRPRTNLFGAVTRIRHSMAQAVHRFFHEQGFYWVNTPIISTSDAEGAGQMFRISTLDMMNLPRTAKGEVADLMQGVANLFQRLLLRHLFGKAIRAHFHSGRTDVLSQDDVFLGSLDIFA
jgi:asparaginyl-tRNA synthetase